MPYTSTLNQILHDTLHHHPDCEAAAYLDLQSMKTLGMYAYPRWHREYDSDVMHMLNHLVMDIFSNKFLLQLTDHFRYSRNLSPGEEYFQDILIHGLNHSYVCIRSESYAHHMLVFVFSNDVAKGMMLREAKLFTEQIQSGVSKISFENQVGICEIDEDIVILDNHIPTPPTKSDAPSVPRNHHSGRQSQPNPNDILAALDKWRSG